MSTDVSAEDRVISLGSGLAAIPERLMLSHARGEVLFICGAGISRPANLPDFRELVLDIYAVLDTGVHAVLTGLPRAACNQWVANCAGLTERQTAEVKRYIVGDYDVVRLNVLELGNLTDLPFLKALASALEAAVSHGLDIGRRLGWEGQRRLLQLGDLGRVYYLVAHFRCG